MDQSPETEINNSATFFIGTYTNGESLGIYKCELDEDGKFGPLTLQAQTNNPSFLTKSVDQKFLLAVNETNSNQGSGTIESYEILPDTLRLISQSSSAGAHPCHININDSGDVLTANYTGGNIALHQLNGAGELSDVLDVEQHIGSGLHERQDAAHAHSVWFHQSADQFISVDLGTNELRFAHVHDDKIVPAIPENLQMAPKAGPRHLTIHPNNQWIYVLNELDCTITHVINSESGYAIQESFSILPTDFKEKNTGADIHITSDGKFVYASNRGHNSIAIFEVNPEDGSLIAKGHESTLGQNPRNFAISPDNKYLLVANQTSNNIISFKISQGNGMLEFVNEIKAPTPVCLLF